MKKNYIYNILLSIFNILFPILSFPYASRVLGPTGIGKFQFVTSFAQYFVLIASLGIPLYGMREIAKRKNDKAAQSKVFLELIIINLIMSVLLTLIYVLIVYCFDYFNTDRTLYVIVSVTVLLSFTSIDWLFIGLEDFKLIAVRSMLVKAIALILLFVFVKTQADLANYFYISIFSSLANNIINFISLKSRIEFNWYSFAYKPHIKPLVFIFANSLAVSMYTLMDIVLLGFLSNARSVGLYSAAVKLTKIVIPVLTSIGTVLMPQMAHDYASKNYSSINNLRNKSFHITVLFSVPAFVGLALLAPEFILLFSGKEFMDAVVSMQILSLLPLIIGFNSLWGHQTIVAAGKDKEMMITSIIGMIIGIGLNILLVPILQYNGASIANIVTEIAVLLILIYYEKKYFSFTLKWDHLFKAILSCLIFIPIIIYSRHVLHNPILVVIVSALVCMFSYFITQWFIFKDEIIVEAYKKFFVKLKLS